MFEDFIDVLKTAHTYQRFENDWVEVNHDNL